MSFLIDTDWVVDWLARRQPAVDLLHFDEETMRTYARVRGELRRQRQPIGEGDLLIAATALTYDADLVTRNLKDFTRVPGLRLYDGDRSRS